MLEGQNFHIIINHKFFVYAFKSNQMSLRQTQLLFISEFTIDIRHVTDAENILASAFSY